MDYIFLKSTTLLLFAALSIVGAASVLDTEGRELFNGRQYYIRPQNMGIGGGLTTTSKNKDETSDGMPPTMTSPVEVFYILVKYPVSIAFEERISVCVQSMGWRVTLDDSTGRLYVTTGGSQFNPRFSFEEVEGESNSNVYKIRFDSGSGEVSYVGFFKNDGLLGITNDIPLPVVFKKAFYFIEEITSSS